MSTSKPLVSAKLRLSTASGPSQALARKEAEVRLFACLLQGPPRLQRGLDEIKELGNQRVALALQEISAPVGEVKLIALLEQVRAGWGRYFQP